MTANKQNVETGNKDVVDLQGIEALRVVKTFVTGSCKLDIVTGSYYIDAVKRTLDYRLVTNFKGEVFASSRESALEDEKEVSRGRFKAKNKKKKLSSLCKQA